MKYPRVLFAALGIAALAATPSLVGKIKAPSSSSDTFRDAPGAPKKDIFIFDIGDKIITKSGKFGRVRGVLASATPLKYSVRMDGSIEPSNYFASELGQATGGACTTGSNYKFCIEDEVVTKKNKTAIVKGFFQDRSISAKIHSLKKEIYNYPPSELAQTSTRSCSKGSNYKFCTGDYVITKPSWWGRVKGVFPDGELSVEFNHGHTYLHYPPSELAIRTAGSCSTGANYHNYHFCVGDKVIITAAVGKDWFGKDRKGTIMGVFPDGALAIYEGTKQHNIFPILLLKE